MMKKRIKKVKRKKRTKKITKRSGLTFKKLVKAVKAVKRKFKSKNRLELDIPTSTKFVSLNPLGYTFKSQVFIKDNKARRILNGPIDFDHAVTIIGFYNEHPKKALPKWLVRR